MINRQVNSHGNHPGPAQNEERRSRRGVWNKLWPNAQRWLLTGGIFMVSALSTVALPPVPGPNSIFQFYSLKIGQPRSLGYNGSAYGLLKLRKKVVKSTKIIREFLNAASKSEMRRNPPGGRRSRQSEKRGLMAGVSRSGMRFRWYTRDYTWFNGMFGSESSSLISHRKKKKKKKSLLSVANAARVTA